MRNFVFEIKSAAQASVMAHRVPRVPRAAQLARPNGLVHAAFYEKWTQVDQLLQHGTADLLERDNNGAAQHPRSFIQSLATDCTVLMRAGRSHRSSSCRDTWQCGDLISLPLVPCRGECAGLG